MEQRLYSWPEVRPLLGGVCRMTAWRQIKAGQLPAPIKVSAQRVAWRAADIAAWQAGKRDWLT